MEDRSLFISSCSRRELARRKPGARPSRARLVLLLGVFLIALAAVVVLRGGL
jgi:hypothetical protein